MLINTICAYFLSLRPLLNHFYSQPLSIFYAFDVDNNILLRYERRSFKVDNKKDSKKEEYLYFNYFALHCRSRTSYLLYPEDKNINSKSSKKYDDKEVSSNQKLPDNMLDEDDEISEDNKGPYILYRLNSAHFFKLNKLNNPLTNHIKLKLFL